MLSRFVTAFLPMGKHLLISWLQSPFTVILFFVFCFFFTLILEPKKIKSVPVSTFPFLFAMKLWDPIP